MVDIYPLTLINIRFGGYITLNAPEDSRFVQDVNTEEVSHRLKEWIEDNVSPCSYHEQKSTRLLDQLK